MGARTQARAAADLYRFPKLDADPDQIKGYALRHFAPFNAYRNSRLENVAKAIYYEQGNQWLELDSDVLVEGVRGYAFRSMRFDEDEAERPMPVTNLITSSVDVEFSTLSKRQWNPKIPNLTRDPRQAAANKVANSILRHRMKKIEWPTKRNRFIRNDILQGTAIFKSFWNRTWTDTAWFAAKEPHKCEECAALFSSPNVPGTVANALASGVPATVDDSYGEGDEDVQLDGCPYCAGQLSPYELDEEESHGMDAVGRPLGKMMPRGNTDLELYNPFEYYPGNGGIGETPESLKTHGLVKVRSLDWIEDHYPDFVDEVEPEDPTELMRWHPTLGDWDIVGRHDTRMDSGIYDCHARVYELIALPSRRYPKGRYIVLIGEVQQLIVENTELMIEIDDEEGGKACVPRVEVAIGIWKEREGELWGRGIADDLFSPQNRLNAIDSQTIEARERMGSPNLLVPTDADLQGPEFRSNYGLGKMFRYQPSALNPNIKPEVFGAVTMPAGVVNERDRCIQDMTRIVGPADIEIGEAPRNVTTTSGLQILGEQAERKRATRELSITEAFIKVWEHQMQMLWVLRVDEDFYEEERPDGSWELKQYDRLAIKGQTKVEIEKQAYIERSIVVREGAREAMTDGLYDRSTPTARKRLLELMGLPTDVNDEDNLQIEHARRTWVDFKDDGIIPVVDTGIDNPLINYMVLGAFLKQDEGKAIAEHACWKYIVAAVAGWEQDYQTLKATDDMTRATYGGSTDPKQTAETYARLTLSYQTAKAGYDQAIEAAKLTPGAPPPTQAPPQPPPPPIFVPRQIEKRIMLVWQSLLSQDPGWMPYLQQKSMETMTPLPELAANIQHFLQFRAVVEAYRILGQPTLAPGSTPGGPEAAGGIGPGAPAPGAGIGPPPPGMAPGGAGPSGQPAPMNPQPAA